MYYRKEARLATFHRKNGKKAKQLQKSQRVTVKQVNIIYIKPKSGKNFFRGGDICGLRASVVKNGAFAAYSWRICT